MRFAMNRYLRSLLCVGLASCSLSVDKDFIFFELVAPGGPSPVVDEIAVTIEGTEAPVIFVIDPPQAVPASSAEFSFSMALDFPKEARGKQLGLEISGLFNGETVLLGATRATVERSVEVPVEVAVLFCGNGAEDSTLNEECDDNNRNDNDGCSAGCKDEFCGDGVKQTNEQCDDDNNIDGDGCDQLCFFEDCGDGIVQLNLGEECDDGNGIEGDACDSNCTFPGCGNGIVDPNQFCYGTPTQLNLGIVGAINNFASGDLDQDGDLDLVILEAGATDKALLVLNNNDQLIVDNFIPLSADPEQVVITDITGDGLNDIIIQTNTLLVFENQNNANFIQVADFNAGGLSSVEELDGLQVADIDADGDKDIVAIQQVDKIKIIKNDGNLGFSVSQTLVLGNNVAAVLLVDIDNDLDLDLVSLVGRSDEIRTLTNNNGSFSPKQTIPSPANALEPRWISSGDFDKDGDQDFLVSCFGGTSMIRLINDGAGNFSVLAFFVSTTTDILLALTVSDFNQDNDLDFLVSDGVNGITRIFKNVGNNSYQQEATFSITPVDSIAFDFTGDGVDDLFFDVQSNNPVVVLSNP